MGLQRRERVPPAVIIKEKSGELRSEGYHIKR